MLQVFSEKKDLISQTGGDISTNSFDDQSGNFDLSLSPTTRDPLALFDGTEIAKSSAMMAQDFSLDFGFTDDEINLNINQILENCPPSFNGIDNDPILGNFQGLDEVCSKSDAIFSQLSFDSTAEKLETNSDMIAGNDNQVMEQPVADDVYFDEDEESEEPSSESSSPVETSPPSLQPQQAQPFQQQQQQRVMPSIAFNSRLLQPAPPIQQPTPKFRVVKFNPQSQPQQRPVRGPSNFSATSYSPPPTPSNSRSAHTRGAVYARQYRQKNREHVEQLEAENDRLVRENDKLRNAYEHAQTENEKLSREITYLRQVLQNDSSIASILNAVACNAPGLKLQFPMAIVGANQQQPDQSQQSKRTIETRSSSKRKNEDQSDQLCAMPTKPSRGNDDGPSSSNNGGPGVCLHVNNGTVSVEFCSRCSREAKYVNDQQQSGRQEQQ